jgi:hypothetical protein
LEAVQKASATKATKEAEEIAAKKAKEDAKLERESLKEAEKERVRQEKQKEKELSNQLKQDATEAAATKKGTTFKTAGAAVAVPKKRQLGTKRYQMVQPTGQKDSKAQKMAIICNTPGFLLGLPMLFGHSVLLKLSCFLGHSAVVSVVRELVLGF